MTDDIIETEAIQVNDRRLSAMPETTDDQVQDNSTTDIVLVAMQKGYEPEFIEKMMDLAERNQANIARQAYFDALANFKAEAPQVKKDKYNKFFNSWYTSLGNLLDTYNPYLGKNGLSISFPLGGDTIQDKKLIVTVKLSHRLGHSEEITISFPIDIAATGGQSGKKSRNDIQDIKSTFTYGRSMTVEAILGVAGTEASMDDDGNAAGKQPEYITPDQVIEIIKGIKEKNIPKDQYLGLLSKFAKVEILEVESIPSSAYNEAVRLIKKAKGTPKVISCPEADGKDVPITDCDKCDIRKGCPSWE